MKAIAVSPVLNQAVADLSAGAQAFLCDVHAGTAGDIRARAEAHARNLREFVRDTGAVLDDLPAWQANTTGWRAIARLAHPLENDSQAG